MQPELRYGWPVCDEILTGRYFTIGYSWYFRQPKWVLEIINRNDDLTPLYDDFERPDTFRADVRIPKRFRAGLEAYKGSGYDRGHLVSSANQRNEYLQNSETFLLSNISPQRPEFNRGIWKALEEKIRELNGDSDILETYVLTAPVFYFEQPITVIGREEELGITVPVPHAFVKSVLTENKSGKLALWTFLMNNEKLDGAIEDYLISTFDAEQLVGGRFWDRISGNDSYELKKGGNRIW